MQPLPFARRGEPPPAPPLQGGEKDCFASPLRREGRGGFFAPPLCEGGGWVGVNRYFHCNKRPILLSL